MKTNRGFEIQHFKDDYGVDCTIQESSSCDPHIWLGVQNPKCRVIWYDAKKLGIKTDEDAGWYDYPIPEEVLVESMMHLSQEQARQLAEKLLYFAETSFLKEEYEK